MDGHSPLIVSLYFLWARLSLLFLPTSFSFGTDRIKKNNINLKVLTLFQNFVGHRSVETICCVVAHHHIMGVSVKGDLQ
jgi:hypothetical protein